MFATGFEYELDNLGMYVLYAVGWVGVLNWLSRSGFRSPRVKLIAVTGVLLLLSYGFPILFGSRAILPERWGAFLYCVLAVSAGAQLSSLGQPSKRKSAGIALGVAILAFFMVTSSTANMETPIYSQDRVAFWGYRQSDIYAANLVAQYPLQITTDQFFASNLLKYTLLKEADVLMLEDLNELTAVKEAVLLRTGINLEIPDKPTALFSINYVMRLENGASPELVGSRNLLFSTGDVYLYDFAASWRSPS